MTDDFSGGIAGALQRRQRTFTGGALSQPLYLLGDPKVSYEAATKGYVDAGLLGKSDTAHNHDAAYAALAHRHRLGFRRERGTSAQTLTSGAETTLNFNTLIFNEASAYLSWDSTNHRFDVLADCTVLITAGVSFVSNNTGIRRLRINHSGSIIAASDTNPTGTTRLNVATLTRAVAGESFSVQAFQNSGGNLDVNPSPQTFCAFMVT